MVLYYNRIIPSSFGSNRDGHGHNIADADKEVDSSASQVEEWMQLMRTAEGEVDVNTYRYSTSEALERSLVIHGHDHAV